ncbi:MAG: hypothetical protein RLZZ350_885 [Verrucomicrobiota bacterium]
MEGVEPTHPSGYKILSLARLPIPPHRLTKGGEYKFSPREVNGFVSSISNGGGDFNKLLVVGQLAERGGDADFGWQKFNFNPYVFFLNE